MLQETHHAEIVISGISKVFSSVKEFVSPFSLVTSVVHSILVTNTSVLQRIGFTYCCLSGAEASPDAVASVASSAGTEVQGSQYV